MVKYYTFVIIDDYFRYTWVLFLTNEDDAFDAFKVFCKMFKMKKDISCIRSDYDGELKIVHLKVFAMILALNTNFYYQGLHNKMN